MKLGAHIMLFVLKMAIKFDGLITCPTNVTSIDHDKCLLFGVVPLVYFVLLFSLKYIISICFKKNRIKLEVLFAWNELKNVNFAHDHV
jgi:hypothetical protein